MKNPVVSLNDLDLQGSYSYADYLSWQLGEMVELIKGRIFRMSPAPNTYHQIISGNVFALLKIKTKGQKCKPFAAPTDVRIITKSLKDEDIVTVVQPDLFVVCDPAKLDERGCLGSPDFIVEILSPSTSSRDLTEKYSLYEESGVMEYWVIFPGDQIIECFVLENGSYKKAGVYAQNDVIPVRTLDGVSLLVEEIFER